MSLRIFSARSRAFARREPVQRVLAKLVAADDEEEQGAEEQHELHGELHRGRRDDGHHALDDPRLVHVHAAAGQAEAECRLQFIEGGERAVEQLQFLFDRGAELRRPADQIGDRLRQRDDGDVHGADQQQQHCDGDDPGRNAARGGVADQRTERHADRERRPGSAPPACRQRTGRRRTPAPPSGWSRPA